ncbi:MAG: MFS transporter [Chthoniobacter sp.]
MNRKWLIVGSLGVWSGVTLVMGTAHDFTTLIWLRRAMGISEAFYIPAGLSLIADYHRGTTRSLAVGIHMSGIYMGQALGGVGGWIAQSISWRTAFASCGWVGVAYGVVLAVFLEDKPERGSVTTSPEPRPDPRGVPVLWIGYAMLVVCFALPSLSGWAVKNWLPTLLQDRFFLDQKSSGLWATVTNASAAFCGVLVGGRLSDFLFTRHTYGRTWVSGSGLLLTALAIAGVGLAPGFAVVIACAALYGFDLGCSMRIACPFSARWRPRGFGRPAMA